MWILIIEETTQHRGGLRPSLIEPATSERCSFSLLLLYFDSHASLPHGSAVHPSGGVDPSLPIHPRPRALPPAAAACWCTMARREAEGCRGGLWCQRPTARARAGVALPDSSWAARTMRARPWTTAWGQTWSFMRTTKTQTRYEPHVTGVTADFSVTARFMESEFIGWMLFSLNWCFLMFFRTRTKFVILPKLGGFLLSLSIKKKDKTYFYSFVSFIPCLTLSV